MLLQFSVENFLSIKDRVTLSMLASNDKSLDYNIFKCGDNVLLKSAAIYGPNASGKTNILKAISYMSNLILTSHKLLPGQNIETMPFALDKTSEEKPSSFETVLIIDNVKYIYGLSLDRKMVYKEYLYYYPNKKPAVIFERGISEPGKFRFTADKKTQNEKKNNTPPNALYLSMSASMGYEKTSKVVRWFVENFRSIIYPRDPYSSQFEIYTKNVLLENNDMKDLIIKLVSKADREIKDLEVSEIEISEDILKDLPKTFKKAIVEDLRKEVKTAHRGIDKDGNEITVWLNLFNEAGGTRKIFNMAGPFIDVLSNGRLLVVDELETNLHPHLVCYLIDIFNSPKYNKKGAQLIFTAHNTILLDQDVLRRDQIWFTEKKDDQGTNLYSLYEYKARNDDNIEKRYLAGRYGAIPNLD